jgi:excinuclease ABC subunit B
MVIMYADRRTESMNEAIRETDRRRRIQLRYNEEHQIIPASIQKGVASIFESLYERKRLSRSADIHEDESVYVSLDAIDARIDRLEAEMKKAAEDMAFERAADLRDRIRELRRKAVFDF